MPYVNKPTPNLEKLVEFDSDYEILVVPVHVDKWAKKADCYPNVQRCIASSGGNIQYGWVLIENDWMVEAKHHAVWEKKDGSLVDITPRETPVHNILFIPDDRLFMCVLLHSNRFRISVLVFFLMQNGMKILLTSPKSFLKLSMGQLGLTGLVLLCISKDLLVNSFHSEK
jgi:hypothetical protein